jgi:hypothetical protein
LEKSKKVLRRDLLREFLNGLFSREKNGAITGHHLFYDPRTKSYGASVA